MREKFPTTIRPGSRLTTGYLNDVGRMLNRAGQFVPGSGMSGIRTGPFDADQAQKPTIVRPVEVTRFIRMSGEGAGDYEAIDFKPNIVLAPGARFLRDYGCKLLNWREVSNTIEGEPAYEYDDDDDTYVINTYWLENQFLLPAYYARGTDDQVLEADGESVVIPGDRVLAVWDSISGKFIAVEPPLARVGRVYGSSISAGDGGPIDVFYSTPAGEGTSDLYYSGITVQAHNYLLTDLAVGDAVSIQYAQPLREWFIVGMGTPRLASAIDFELSDDLTTETQSAEAIVTNYYDGADPAEIDPTSPGSLPKVRVWNPNAGCTGNLFRYFGSAGCTGQAYYNRRDDKYVIWQLDCEQEL